MRRSFCGGASVTADLGTGSGKPRRGIRIALALGALALGVLLVGGGILAVTRYLPALDEARALRSDLEALARRAQGAALSLDRPTLDELKRDLAAGRARLDGLSDLLADDPLLGLARSLPPTEQDVRGADALMVATRDLFQVADEGLAIADAYVRTKADHAADPASMSMLTRLVGLMADTHDRAVAAQVAMRRARVGLATVPDGPMGALAGIRDAMSDRLDTYAPMLDGYVGASARLPAILGWDGPRRYLVLTQNPAELRPTGGYTGSYGVLTFERGRVTERAFSDVALLDFPWDYPYIDPPRELTDYLLGPGQPWQFADANWSPDFPTSARDALRLYANESGDDRFDGVLAITTYTIDELLGVMGPIEVPEYGATIASGETTLKTIQLTRVAREGENRKAFLSTFADHLFDGLSSLPPERWADLVDRAGTFGNERLVLAWFKDPLDQRLAQESGFDGGVREDPGDYLYPVDSNVAPASKLNAITTRRLRLDVRIDAYGDVRHTLDVTWDNPIEDEAGRPYRSVPTLEDLRILGMYFRALVPTDSIIESVSGGTLVRLTAPALIGTEAGRSVFGTYLMIPPGETSLRYVWTSPRPIEDDPAGGYRYRLTVQKQPGLRPGPLSVTIGVPPGFRIDSASRGLEATADTAGATMAFDRDVEFDIHFSGTGAPSPPITPEP